MWIRSSDKESIVNMESMDLITVEEGNGDYIIMAYESGQAAGIAGIVLGHYETREMAMNDLRELCCACEDWDGVGIYTMEKEENIC